MAHIDDVPEQVTGAGQDFNYTGPALASLVLVNAPLDPEHQNTGLNRAAYDAYIAAEVAGGRAYSAAQFNVSNPEYDIAVKLTYGQASQYNYGRLTIGGRSWYVFYTAEYLNLESTRMVAELDAWPSYDWSLGYSMIERGHVGVAVSQTDTYGADYCTTPEPIAVSANQGALTTAALPDSELGDYTVLVISSTDLRGTGTGAPYFDRHVFESAIGQAAGFATDSTAGPTRGIQVDIPEANYPWKAAPDTGPDTFRLYVPYARPSPVSRIDGVACGGGVYLFTPSGFAAWMTVLQGAPWVVDGILDMRFVPSWSLSDSGGDGSFTAANPPEDPTDARWGVASDIPVFVGDLTTVEHSSTHLSGWRDTLLAEHGAQWYRKLITSPYVDILIGNGSGVEHFAPDQWQSSGIAIEATSGAAHGDMSIHVTPGYGALGPQMGLNVAAGGVEGLTTSGFGRGASNTAQADLTPWNSAFTTFTNREVMTDQQALALDLALTQTNMNLGILGMQNVLGLVGSAPNPGSLYGAAISTISSQLSAGISANNSIDVLDISQDGSLDIAAYQLGVTGVSTWRGFDAWVQGLRALAGAGSMSKLASAWRTLRGQSVDIIIATPTAERIRAALTMWRRYGYMIHRPFRPTRLDVMSKFSYWKTAGATIVGAVPQKHRGSIAAAFDGAGVTVWSSIAEIGTDQSVPNSPIPGAYY